MGATILPPYNHSEAEDLLLDRVGGEMLANHVMITRPWEPHTHHIPSSLRAIATKEFTFFDNDVDKHSGRHRIDVLFFCGAGDSTAFRNENFTVGVEVKVTVENLFCDQKIQTYFDRTDFLYLAVPDQMLFLGLMKASQWEHVGVVSLNSGKIYKPARRQRPNEHERTLILEKLLLEKKCSKVHASINPTVHGLNVHDGLRRLDWSKGHPVFVSVDLFPGHPQRM